MRTRDEIWQRLNELSAEIEELRREIILLPDTTEAEVAADEQAWARLGEISKDVSRLWTGPDAVGEIRSQREK